MREYKALTNEKEWVYGYPVPSKSGNIICIYPHIDICEDYEDDEVGAIAPYNTIDTNTLCQFTGLHDKNGTKIFEGDQMSEDYMSSDNSMGVLPNGWTFDKDEDVFTVVWDNALGGWTFEFDKDIPKEVKEEFGDYAGQYMKKYMNHARHILVCGNQGIGELTGANIHDTKTT